MVDPASSSGFFAQGISGGPLRLYRLSGSFGLASLHDEGGTWIYLGMAFRPPRAKILCCPQDPVLHGAGRLQPVPEDRLGRSRSAGCDGSRILFPGKSCRNHGALSPGFGMAVFLRGSSRSRQLPLVPCVLDLQFCAARGSATEDDARDGKPSASRGWSRAPTTRQAERIEFRFL